MYTNKGSCIHFFRITMNFFLYRRYWCFRWAYCNHNRHISAHEENSTKDKTNQEEKTAIQFFCFNVMKTINKFLSPEVLMQIVNKINLPLDCWSHKISWFCKQKKIDSKFNARNTTNNNLENKRVQWMHIFPSSTKTQEMSVFCIARTPFNLIILKLWHILDRHHNNDTNRNFNFSYDAY